VDNMPSKFVKLRAICNVPLSKVADLESNLDFADESSRLGFLKMLRRPKPAELKKTHTFPKHVTLNTAAWMSFPEPIDSPVSLWLTYRDDKGELSVLIDEQSVDQAGSFMLSGNVDLKFTGKVQYIKVCCGGFKDGERFSVDELYVEKAEAQDVLQRRAS